MSQKKVFRVTVNVDATTFLAIQRYITDNDAGQSEFVRECLLNRLLEDKYLEEEQMRDILLGR